MKHAFHPLKNWPSALLGPVSALLLLVGAQTAQAQVATAYSFSQSAGTFTPITGGTQLENTTFLFIFDIAPFDNNVSAAQTIPAFNYNGTVYTQMYVSNNGFITFGSAPTGTNFTPLSSGEGYAGAISAVGCDLHNTTNAITPTRDVRWQTVGNEIVVQWRGVRRKSVASEGFAFQIRLNTVTRAIQMVYGPFNQGPGSNTAIIPEVGLRGPNNTFATQVNNRLVGTGAENWATSLPGTANNSNVRLTSAAPAKSWTSGLTYTFTPCSPVVTVTPPSASICPGGSVLLTASGATTYTWAPATGLSATTGASVTANPSTTTTYTVTGSNPGCPFTGITTVTVTALPGLSVPVITPPSATTCAGSPQVLSASATSSATVTTPFSSTGGPATMTVTGAQNASVYPWNLTTSGLPVSGVTVASVTLNGITHTFPDDLDILLQSPTGTNVILMSDAGGSNAVSGVNYTFATGSPAMSDAGANATGTYAPTNFGTPDDWPTAPGPGSFSQASPTLTSFTGNLNGVWKLLIRDDANGDAGSITSWSITFSQPAAVIYTWSPNIALSGTTGPTVTASPTSTQVYTVTVSHGPNACTNSANVTITVNPLPVVTCGSYGPVCVDAADITLVGSPVGGTWSGTGVTGSTFDPSAGTQLVTYTYTDGNSCTNSCNTTITVNPLPVVTCPPNSGTCINLPAFALTGGSPAGGTYSGTGVSAGNFDPATAGLGPHTITYSYTDGNGCSSSCTFTMTVNDLPVVTCGTYGPACSNDPDIALGGTPVGGTWSGTGVTGSNFDPSAGTQLVTYTFTDGNGCSNSCSTTITVTTATTWYADTDGDTYGDPADDSLSCGTPVGYVLDNSDDCPTVFGLNGDSCNDGNPFTSGDVLVACVCTGTPVPCDTWTLTINTDGAGSETSWQMVDATSPFVLASGGSYPNNATINQNICVPQGACFDLIMVDAGGNGISPGGWLLRDNNNKRVIDNVGNGSAFTDTAQVDLPFCSPVGNDALTIASCDKMTWLSNEYIVANPNPAVSAEWGIGNQMDDGYQMWFFDPTGGYSRRILHSHAVSYGYGPPSATRACHMPLNFTPNPLPFNTLLNVRVRSLVNGVYSDFGAACRFMLLPAPPACPTTQLDNNPLHMGTTYSCGATGKVVGASGYPGKIWALPVGVATNYKFKFELASEGYLRNISTTSYHLALGIWTTNPLLCGTFTYDVSVAVSVDGGASYCPFGPICTVEVTNTQPSPYCTPPIPFSGGGQHMGGNDQAEMTLWPNPNRGEQLNLSLTEMEEGVTEVTVDIHDLFGKVVITRVIAVEGAFTTVLDLGTDLAGGLYTVSLTAGTKTYNQRLIIE